MPSLHNIALEHSQGAKNTKYYFLAFLTPKITKTQLTIKMLTAHYSRIVKKKKISLTLTSLFSFPMVKVRRWSGGVI